MDLLQFLNEQVMREQEIYWQRFYAFATLQAGAFLLTTSPVGKTRALSLGALFLAVVWAWVQALSLGYVNRLKRRYHDFRLWLDIPFAYEEHGAPKGHGRVARWWHATKARLQTSPASSSTDIGVGVTILVAGFWVYYFFSQVFVAGLTQGSQPAQQPAVLNQTGWLSSLGSIALSGAVGALTSLLVTWYYDQATSPRVEIIGDDTPRQTGQHTGSARHQFLQIKVKQAKGSWPFVSRRAALNCRAILDVLNADGTRALDERITARWSGSLQPYRTQVVGETLAQIPDSSLLPLGQRLDVHSYSKEQIGIAVKFEGGDDCWIFSNESYLFNKWQKPEWKLARGRYYLRCEVYYEASTPAMQWFLLSNEGPGFDDWSIEPTERGL